MSIKKAVIKAIDKKLKEAQALCDSEVKSLRDEKSYSISKAISTVFEEIGRIRASYSIRKAEVEARHINNILSKII